ncbi:hypothetical protein WAK64_00115 [Bacillus spongiae]|uniref:Uncharacterized protein n=1 Tax=Bacillus spongiae TaxID=2683610 RepID=A0ABU8H825_9BACI
MSFLFTYNPRLKINLPNQEIILSHYSSKEQQSILSFWEKCRGNIPELIKAIEININEKQEALSNEDEFEKSCQLNEEIAELASKINDLWLWYRTQPLITDK